MEYRKITSYEEFKALKSDWTDLLANVEKPQVFYRHEWTDCFISFYAPQVKQNLCIIAGYDREKLVVLLPFQLVGKTISFLTPLTVDYNNVYVYSRYNRASLIRNAVDCLLNETDVVRFDLGEIPSSAELHLLKYALEGRGFKAFIKESSRCSLITDSHKYDKKNYKDILRRERRLAESHEVEIQDDVKLDDELYEFISKQKKLSFGADEMYRGNVKSFYKNLAETLDKDVSVAVMRIDGRIAAAHLGFGDDKKFYYYIPVYDKEYSSLGVGAILLKHLVEKNVPERVFDFLRGDEDYKYDWTDDVNANYNLTAYRRDCSRISIMKERLRSSQMVREILGR